MKGKYSKPFKLVMALALVAGLVPIVAAPAQACITGDLDPIGGPPGTEVIVYYGNTYAHAWEYGNPAVAANSTLFGDIPVEHDMGRFREDVFVFAIPNVPPGDYTVRVPEATGRSHMDLTFTVTTGEVIPNSYIDVHLDPADVKYRDPLGYLSTHPIFEDPDIPNVPIVYATPAPIPTAAAAATPTPAPTSAPTATPTPTPTPASTAAPTPTPTTASTAAPGGLWLWLTALLVVVVVLVVWALVRRTRR